MKKFLRTICFIGWVLSGLVSVKCMFRGFANYLGKFFGAIVAFIFGEIPFLGQIMGIIGGMKTYDWGIFEAFLKVALIPIACAFLFGILSDK